MERNIHLADPARNRIRESLPRRVFLKFNVVFLILICAVMLYPVIYVISASLSAEQALLQGRVFLWPVNPHIKAFEKVFDYPNLLTSYRNTIVYTLAGTALNLILTVFGAWALCQKRMPGRRFLTLMCTFTMFFSGGMIPTFLVVKDLGMLDSIWAILCPSAVSTYNMILMRTFFMNIPDSLTEAAELDGCNDFGILFKIVLPLSLASLMTIGMFYAVAHWNGYFNAMLYLSTPSKFPLQIILRQVVLESQIVENSSSAVDSNMAEGIKYATIVVAMLPMLCVYPFVQRYFVKGVMVGSVKG
ncbi:MAG: carbohydrate ABC transporter permease [Candidatus Hydrogenedens sp.]|jgi:ABC-type glycerol-3-phosphate transport system permease component|nr:carbohydrate ABC transporter permease [Candidatus Hydrogenedens sp.]